MQPLRQLRISVGLTQKELAKSLDVPVGVISRLESEPLPDHYAYLIKLSGFFHATIDFLLGNKPQSVMSFEQHELLRIYQSLDDFSKGKLYARIISIAEESAQKSQKRFGRGRGM